MCDNLRNTESTTSSRYSLPYYGEKEGIRCPKFENEKSNGNSKIEQKDDAPVWRGHVR